MQSAQHARGAWATPAFAALRAPQGPSQASLTHAYEEELPLQPLQRPCSAFACPGMVSTASSASPMSFLLRKHVNTWSQQVTELGTANSAHMQVGSFASRGVLTEECAGTLVALDNALPADSMCSMAAAGPQFHMLRRGTTV